MTAIWPVPTTAAGGSAAPRTVSVLEAASQSLTMAGRGLVKIRQNPQQLFDVIILPVVFTVMFSTIFGGAIAGDVAGYLPLLVPGVLVQVALAASVTTGVALREDINTGVFDRFASLPIARIAPLAGLLLADVVRYVIATVMSVSVGLVLGYRPSSALGVIVACVLVVTVAFAISWVFALMGVLMNRASSVQATSMMILMPLTFMSNALVPVSTMPGWMQAIADVNPVSHLVSAVRDLAAGHVGMQIVWSLLGAAVVMAVAVPLTLRVYMRRG